MMKSLADIPDLKGKKVLVRVDFDVPVGEDGKIQETFRIQKQKENLDYLRDHGAIVTLISHISAVPSFVPLMPQLQELLGPIDLKENLRANPGEEANDPVFAQELVQGFDLFINNAFAVCHRAHASVATVPTLLPSYVGLLIEQETKKLSEAVMAPAAGKIIFIGGAKVSTKMPVIEYLLDKAEAIAVGGKVANEMGPSSDPRIHVPTDFAEDKLDIGPETAAAFAALTVGAKMIVWNGPMGKFEDEEFFAGTKILAEAIAASGARTVIGGGDTIAAVDKLGLLDKMSFVSTGGGAMLAFLSGQPLSGLKALGYYDRTNTSQ